MRTATCIITAVLAVAASVPLGCRAASPAAVAARHFYQALDSRPFDESSVSGLMLPGPGRAEIARRFGSIESWAGRVTKNGIMWRAEVIDETTDSDRAELVLVILFNDGTRRRDRVVMVEQGGRWLVDMTAVPGAAAGDRVESGDPS